MIKKLFPLLLLLVILLTWNIPTSQTAAKNKSHSIVIPGQMLVKFKSGVDAEIAKKLLYEKGAVAIQTFRLDPYLFFAEFPKNKNLKNTMVLLKKHSLIKYVEWNSIHDKKYVWKKLPIKKNRISEINYYVIK